MNDHESGFWKLRSGSHQVSWSEFLRLSQLFWTFEQCPRRVHSDLRNDIALGSIISHGISSVDTLMYKRRCARSLSLSNGEVLILALGESRLGWLDYCLSTLGFVVEKRCTKVHGSLLALLPLCSVSHVCLKWRLVVFLLARFRTVITGYLKLVVRGPLQHLSNALVRF